MVFALILGQPKEMVWHKRRTIRVELDARKQMAKETRFFGFFEPTTHLPVGISANLGSITQLVFFNGLKINPKIEDSMFQFSPPTDWNKVTRTSGGWE